jgi:hypothetical protein
MWIASVQRCLAKAFPSLSHGVRDNPHSSRDDPARKGVAPNVSRGITQSSDDAPRVFHAMQLTVDLRPYLLHARLGIECVFHDGPHDCTEFGGNCTTLCDELQKRFPHLAQQSPFVPNPPPIAYRRSPIAHRPSPVRRS